VSTDEQHTDIPTTDLSEESPADSARETAATADEAEVVADQPAAGDDAADDDVNDEADASEDDSSEDDSSEDDSSEADASEDDSSEADASEDDSSDDEDDDSSADATDGTEPAPSGRRSGGSGGGTGDLAARLEREGEIAADFLERLLDIADLDGDLDVDVEGERASVAIVDSSEGRVPRRLVGQNGEVLDALQELTRLAVQARTGDRTRLMLDVAGHRARRREQLVVRAKEAIGEVQQTGEPLRLEAMNPFERKIVHDAVSAAGLQSSSEGVEPDRRIVIRPAS
jgi:spoIIIJ-associated protein